MSYELLFGNACYTASETQNLLDRINAKSPITVKNIHGSWQYFVHSSSNGNLSKVKQLLQSTGESFQSPPVDILESTRIFITPRNISPWSSQASNIAHVCGLREAVYQIERGRIITVEFEESHRGEEDLQSFKDIIYDRMTEYCSLEPPHMEKMFGRRAKNSLEVIDLSSPKAVALSSLEVYNRQMGLGLDRANMEHLVAEFQRMSRSPADIELFMWAQVNSEHCRHHVFNTMFIIDGKPMAETLFDMIRHTHKRTPDFTESAYSDNAAVLSGETGNYWAPEPSDGTWGSIKEKVLPLIKVETHNHPTAISPFPGAATGSGGEIRDEGAVGKGSMPKAGLVGFWVSDLLIPSADGPRPWEQDIGKPVHFASSLNIMLDAPQGSARFNNEFGRVSLTGVFRTLLANTQRSPQGPGWRGYHKPIMIAGGMGHVRPEHALKNPADVRNGAHVIVLGGPGMLIGLGGGAASSSTGGSDATAELDFNSVQRGNPEIERRAQEVINNCTAMGQETPIAFIHDVGAGGLSNAVPELVKDAGLGGSFELRDIEIADKSMSPLQIWCNEAQERYVLLVNEHNLARFIRICERERCGYSDIGVVIPKEKNGKARLVLTDREPLSKDAPPPIDLPMDTLFPPGQRLERSVTRVKKTLQPFDAVSSLQRLYGVTEFGAMITQATKLVFSLPAVGSKMFLITIGDRTVGGLTVRDQLVGPWQVPVADCGVTLTSYSLDNADRKGEAMAMGEKPTLALISPAASARMAVVESLMNLSAAGIKGFGGDMKRVKLSANWMAAVNHPGEAAELYDAVHAIGMELCPDLGLSIPVGKDSTSMKASWKDQDTGESKSVTSPVTVVISAFSLVDDVRKTWTPQLQRVEDVGETLLLFVDLAGSNQAMGGSALAQCLGQIGDKAPDVYDPSIIRGFISSIQQLHHEDVVLAHHDRSDGGLLTVVAEMMFAGRCGVDISMDRIAVSGSESDMLMALFNEELGAVFQVRKADEIKFISCFTDNGISHEQIHAFGRVLPLPNQSLEIHYQSKTLVTMNREQMQQWWSKTSYQMQKLRDKPACAESEFAALLDSNDPGISYNLTYSTNEISPPIPQLLNTRPRVAILREQGINGHPEMAFAFHSAGFSAIDVHMSDILDRNLTLDSFVGLAACGGFSYSDVLGAGQGWAKSILMHKKARATFKAFFERHDTLTLGVCNGCQMLTRIRELIPGTENWPTFIENESQQYEARFSMVKIAEHTSKNSVFFNDMAGSQLPIAVSHGEGRAHFSSDHLIQNLNTDNMIPLRYIDNSGAVTETYPSNPNGSPQGIAGVTSRDGRVLALMPHPERSVMADACSWAPKEQLDGWGAFGPWWRVFGNARRWVG